eukprot:gnl/Chilomastix_caulleri/1601.p3 GENE.gnl/Chilomastix_caulleri/1601~~gnl/Chilomastix_caulleri/1601.p3  ORF type:complete len:60 (-),score=10.99 gnl/Chilomastix_caulleri/1601:457-636(-)
MECNVICEYKSCKCMSLGVGNMCFGGDEWENLNANWGNNNNDDNDNNKTFPTVVSEKRQ